jgi:REP element-mobilizing transposase RayT
MSGDKYYISDQHATYFLTLTVVRWIDIFSREHYRNILVDSLNYCIKEKGLTVHSWVIMSNHVHLVASCEAPHRMSDFLRDFKKFTSKRITEAVAEIPESRRFWLLDAFSFEAKRTGRAKEYKLWKDDNHAIDLTNIDLLEKINYIHENPVRAGLVAAPEHYLFSSALDYCNGKGLVKVQVI